ncbi:MAG: hypothetical protein FJW36_01305 [Acidobacteria bacterium]|nr:hypothetical protein [Acidobacteriota bacterium]
MCAFLLLSVILCPLQAATIGNITIQNNSTADYTINTPAQIAEFRSQSAGPSAVTTIGNTSTFTNRFSWLLGQRAINSDPDALQATANVSYDISFDVVDPTNEGFLLLIDAAGRGWLTGAYESSANGTGVITVDGTTLEASVGVDGNFNPATELDFLGSSLSADEANTIFFNEFLAASG